MVWEISDDPWEQCNNVSGGRREIHISEFGRRKWCPDLEILGTVRTEHLLARQPLTVIPKLPKICGRRRFICWLWVTSDSIDLTSISVTYCARSTKLHFIGFVPTGIGFHDTISAPIGKILTESERKLILIEAPLGPAWTHIFYSLGGIVLPKLHAFAKHLKINFCMWLLQWSKATTDITPKLMTLPLLYVAWSPSRILRASSVVQNSYIW